jgi:hypothetical protein
LDRLATEIGFEPRVERDVTNQTMPTYRFLRRLEKSIEAKNLSARTQTLILESITRLRLLRYVILSFTRPERSERAPLRGAS